MHSLTRKLTHLRGLEVRKYAAGVETWRFGGVERWRLVGAATCRCSDVEARRHATLEARCRCSDVEAWKYGALELWKRAASFGDVEAWRSGGLGLTERAP